MKRTALDLSILKRLSSLLNINIITTSVENKNLRVILSLFGSNLN